MSSGNTSGGMRFGASPETIAKLKKLGKMGGWTLAGLPIAFSAVGELGKGNTASDIAAAAGQGIGGFGAGAAAAALVAPLAPWAAPIAFGLGSMAGGGLLSNAARWVSDTSQGITNDPLEKELREQGRRHQALLQQAQLEDQLIAKIEERRQQQRIEEAMVANQLDQANRFQTAALGAASAGLDPNTAAFLQSMA
jgi:hypothetical protein